MGRYLGASCKLCRRESTKLFLKGSRCLTSKCAIEKRPGPPGQHGQRRQRFSEYNLQLREKQKMKRWYGMMEKQFRIYYRKSEKKQGITGNAFILMLESRLDNIVFRLGFAHSRKQARQLINHGHFLVNDKKVDIPSYVLSENDVIRPKDKSKTLMQSMIENRTTTLPEWLGLDQTTYEGTYSVQPERSDIEIPISEHLVIELYSK